MTRGNERESPSYVPRPRLLEAVMAHRDTPDIKVITGVRRCGKSTVMKMVEDELRRCGTPPSNIFYRRFDAFDVPLGYSTNDLYDELVASQETLNPDHPWYVLLDEIQDVEGWERVVRRLHSEPRIDVYLTGSNARLLSSDLSTYLTGRYVEIGVYPLSFAEYLCFVQKRIVDSDALPKSIDELLADYLLYGGMPGLFELAVRNPRTIEGELRSIYQSILFKDVAQRFRIRDLERLDRLMRFVCMNAESLFSPHDVANALRIGGSAPAEAAVSNMVKALEYAFLVYPVEQTGIQGREILRPQCKLYPVDLGFLGLASAFSEQNARLECAVALELLRRGYRIFVGTGPASEVDFVAVDPTSSEKMYIQVAPDIRSEKERSRALRPLKALTDAHPRLLITLTRFTEETTAEGIKIVHAIPWLTSGAL